MTDLTVSNTILAQMGGRRFLAMTGAKDLLGSVNSLTMRLPSTLTKNRISHVRITLTPEDEYTVEALSIRGLKVKPIDQIEGVYGDTLCSVFTVLTGLHTSL